MPFFELRHYTIRPGKMEEWLDFVHETVIPYQIRCGVVFCGSFRDEQDDSAFIWIRRFESEDAREQVYNAIYQSDEWKNNIGPKVAELIDREAIQVTRMLANSQSPMQ